MTFILWNIFFPWKLYLNRLYLLTDSLVSGRLYWRPPLQNLFWTPIQTLYLLTPVKAHSSKRSRTLERLTIKTFPLLLAWVLSSRQMIATSIVRGNMLRAFGHPVVTCWVLQIELVRMPRRDIVLWTWPNDYNIMEHPQMLREKFDHFQIWDNNPPHVATCRNRVAKRAQHAAPNNVAVCSVQRCCYRLAGALSSY